MSVITPESQIIEKDGKVQVSVEYINWLNEERRKINKTDLAAIDFYQNGEKIDIPTKRVKRFRFIGLSNIDFILSGFYLHLRRESPYLWYSRGYSQSRSLRSLALRVAL